MLTVDALRQIGVNTKEGLGRCLNNEAFYLRLVNMALDDAAFERLAEQMSRIPGLSLEGESYKRPKADKSGHTADWYNRKYFSLCRRCDFGGDLFSPALPQIIADAYASMMPMFMFLSKISSREQ